MGLKTGPALLKQAMTASILPMTGVVLEVFFLLKIPLETRRNVVKVT